MDDATWEAAWADVIERDCVPHREWSPEVAAAIISDIHARWAVVKVGWDAIRKEAEMKPLEKGESK